MAFLFTKKFYCCLIVFASFIVDAQIKFVSTVSPANAGRDEYITLKLTVANGNNIQKIQPPPLNDFTVVSGPNSEMEMNSMNGVTEQYQSLSYVLLPKQPGTIHIGPAVALVDGKLYKSNPVTVNVSGKRSKAQPQSQSLSSMMQMPLSVFDLPDNPAPETQYNDYILHKGESVPDKVNKNMQLKLQTDKTSCFVGEPVLATYKLYTRLQSESSLSKNPSFNGFSVVDMTQNDLNTHKTETLNGRPYHVYIIRKAQLYPLQSGPITLETATLDNKIEFLRSADDGGSPITENVSLNSKPLVINVKPLPEEGKPENFKGAVGNFTIESTLEKNSFSADETGKLLITITGKGNMQLLTKPDISWPGGFEAFDGKTTDNTDNGTVPLSGKKTFEIPFAVEKPGDYNIPAVSFSFFDPATAVYKTVTAREITFHVSAGTGKKTNFPVQKETKEPESLLNKIFARRWLIILLLAGIITTGILVWLNKVGKEQLPEPEDEVQAEKISENISLPLTGINPLSQTEDCLHRNECKEFYSVLNGEMRQFLEQRFYLSENFTVKTLAAAMDKAGIDNNTILQTQVLMQDIDRRLYTPFEQDEKIHGVYATAQTIIGMLTPTVV
jgi:hypothetical protein